jgi:ABC-type polysaccharide/polyol phosphate export permease
VAHAMPGAETKGAADAAPVQPRSPAMGALRDLAAGLARYDLWGRLGWLEVKRRYRRTVIGPFWSVVSLGIFVATIGSVGTALWNQDPYHYVPYLTAGMIAWLMISTSLTEACTLFIANSNLYRHARFDFSLLAYALLWRNFLVFLHHVLVYALVVLVLAPHVVGTAMVLLAPGLLLLFLNGVWVSLLLGLCCLRFRDVQQIVSSMIQIAIFITPLFWPPDQVHGHVRLLFVHLNPLFHCIELVRAPLLGQVPAADSYVAVGAMAAAGWLVTLAAFVRYRQRIAYWS